MGRERRGKGGEEGDCEGMSFVGTIYNPSRRVLGSFTVVRDRNKLGERSSATEFSMTMIPADCWKPQQRFERRKGREKKKKPDYNGRR